MGADRIRVGGDPVAHVHQLIADAETAAVIARYPVQGRNHPAKMYDTDFVHLVTIDTLRRDTSFRSSSNICGGRRPGPTQASSHATPTCN